MTFSTVCQQNRSQRDYHDWRMLDERSQSGANGSQSYCFYHPLRHFLIARYPENGNSKHASHFRKPMVGSVEQIKQDIAALDKAVSELAAALHSSYASYLNALGQAVRQQLILACYHVCTQGYPDQFLQLSFNQRQQLQQTLRNLAEQVQEEILAQLHMPVVPEDPELPGTLSAGEMLPSADPMPVDDRLAIPQPLSTPSEQKLTPMHLSQWQQEMERAIAQELKAASHAANRLLQQADILPKKLPEPLLEAATKSELADTGRSAPNLMNLMVEAVADPAMEREATSDGKGHTVMHIVAVHLRLSDIEFADTSITPVRTQLRNLLVKLKTLGQEYQKKQRERAIGEAQAAWRASWTEGSV